MIIQERTKLMKQMVYGMDTQSILKILRDQMSEFICEREWST